MDSLTTETLFNGALMIMQPRKGYRYTIDPVLLAHFADLNGHEKIMDLGTGAGIIPLILCHRYPKLKIWAIEIQDHLADLAQRNIHANNLEGRVAIIHGDLTQTRSLPSRGSMDHVLANPPYTPHQSGRLNPSDEKAIARHEIRVTLEQLITTAHYLLKDSGCFSLVFPEQRTTELLEKLKAAGLTPRTLRHVHPLARGSAKRILVDAVKHTGASLTILPPLTLFREPGHYSDEVQRMFD